MDQKYPACMSFALAKSYLFQLLRGINYCHIRRVLHRDLKPQVQKKKKKKNGTKEKNLKKK